MLGIGDINDSLNVVVEIDKKGRNCVGIILMISLTLSEVTWIDLRAQPSESICDRVSALRLHTSTLTWNSLEYSKGKSYAAAQLYN
jgi:hypothetical protein